jgi:hypothetical protein
MFRHHLANLESSFAVSTISSNYNGHNASIGNDYLPILPILLQVRPLSSVLPRPAPKVAQ